MKKYIAICVTSILLSASMVLAVPENVDKQKQQSNVSTYVMWGLAGIGTGLTLVYALPKLFSRWFSTKATPSSSTSVKTGNGNPTPPDPEDILKVRSAPVPGRGQSGAFSIVGTGKGGKKASTTTHTTSTTTATSSSASPSTPVATTPPKPLSPEKKTNSLVRALNDAPDGEVQTRLTDLESHLKGDGVGTRHSSVDTAIVSARNRLHQINYVYNKKK